MQRTRTTAGLLLSFVAMSLAVTKISWSSVGTVLRRIVPPLSELGHKGSMGRIGVIGGSVDYCGAPYYSAVSALKFGADLSWVFCSQSSAIPIKAYSPELMVTPFYDENAFEANKTVVEQGEQNAASVSKVVNTFPRLHVLVIGPGLGRHPRVMTIVSGIMRGATKKALPMVIDGDGLFLLSQDLSLVAGNTRCILTPNAREFELLADAAIALCTARLSALASPDTSAGIDNSSTCASTGVAYYEALLRGLRGEGKEATGTSAGETFSTDVKDGEGKTAVLAGRVQALSVVLQGVTVLLKGASDIVASAQPPHTTAHGVHTAADSSSGGMDVVYVVQASGSPRRCGGLGDILSGTTAAALHWALERKDQLQDLATAAATPASQEQPSKEPTLTSAVTTTATLEHQDHNACIQACMLAAMVSKRASELAFAEKGRSMTAPDVVEQLGAAFREFYPEG